MYGQYEFEYLCDGNMHVLIGIGTDGSMSDMNLGTSMMGTYRFWFGWELPDLWPIWTINLRTRIWELRIWGNMFVPFFLSWLDPLRNTSWQIHISEIAFQSHVNNSIYVPASVTISMHAFPTTACVTWQVDQGPLQPKPHKLMEALSAYA